MLQAPNELESDFGELAVGNGLTDHSCQRTGHCHLGDGVETLVDKLSSPQSAEAVRVVDASEERRDRTELLAGAGRRRRAHDANVDLGGIGEPAPHEPRLSSEVLAVVRELVQPLNDRAFACSHVAPYFRYLVVRRWPRKALSPNAGLSVDERVRTPEPFSLYQNGIPPRD